MPDTLGDSFGDGDKHSVLIYFAFEAVRQNAVVARGSAGSKAPEDQTRVRE